MNEIEELQRLLDILLSTLQQVLSSGEILSDELQGLVAKEIQYLTNRISELSRITPQVPDLTQAMPSSNVSAFSYDPEKEKLLVQFLGKYPNRKGSVYSYDNVPKVIFDLFKRGAVPARTKGKNRWGSWWKGKVPSIGASLYTLLKESGFPYQRLT